MYLDKGKIIAPIFLLHALVDIVSDKLVYLSDIPYIPSDFVTSQHSFCQKSDVDLFKSSTSIRSIS